MVGLIYDCVLRDDCLPVLLEHVAIRFGATSAILVYVDPVDAVAAFSYAHGVMNDPEVQKLYNRDFATLDPAPAAMSSLKPGQAASTDLVFAQSMDRCRPFIEGFLHPLGLGGGLAGVVASGGGRIGFFAVHRPRERRIFDEGDVAAFEDLLRHVVRMVELRQVFYHMKVQVDAQRHGLDEAGVGVMVFGADKRLIQASIAVRGILARDDGLSINRFGMLKARDSGANEALGAAFLKSDTAVIVIVPRRHAPLPYALRFAIGPGPSGIKTYSVAIWDPDRVFGDTLDLLQQAFSLTASSAKLVGALMQGQTLAGYAVTTGLSRSTVKFHLNAAFKATGTRRQSDLMSLAMGLVRDLAPSERT